MRRKKKKEGSCYIVRCQGDARNWIVLPGNLPQHVCDDCKDYMVDQLKWQLAEANSE